MNKEILRVTAKFNGNKRVYDHYFEYETEKEYHDKLDQIEFAAEATGIKLISIEPVGAE